eukprot:9499582-Pyramimonas_sp.AAC.1
MPKPKGGQTQTTERVSMASCAVQCQQWPQKVCTASRGTLGRSTEPRKRSILTRSCPDGSNDKGRGNSDRGTSEWPNQKETHQWGANFLQIQNGSCL